ncbi:hypothetical protein ColLi_06016 [Colletotrichum liriopes]|uniref:Rhodopsin domain-containing protein n=1 Tax=Colletotrichum liriopes TaxID=708192 RepID=A0AA37GLG5_9PEZI|nr:hypothetical protein ColLi_06016 [Colletotrichum liriopes]
MTGWTYNAPDDTPTNGPQIAAVCTAFTAVALFLVCLRLYVRTTLVKAVGYETKWGLGITKLEDMPDENVLHFGKVEKQYDPSIPADVGYCVDAIAFYLTFSSLTIVFDVLIMFLPFPVIIKSQIQNRKKLVLLALFVLGGFVTIIQAIRIQTIKNLVNYLDSAKSIQWSVIETCIGIIIACIPTLAPMVKYFAEKSRNFTDGNSKPRNSRYALQTWGTKRSGMQPLGTGIDREVSITESSATKPGDSTENILDPGGIAKRTDLQVTTQDAPETWSNKESKQDV